MKYICKYCGKEIGNKGCLVLHEKRCVKNPNRVISKTQLYKEDKDSRRDENGKIVIRKKFKHNEITKKILSEKRKKWLSEHKDAHPWKNNLKFISKPCEELKKYLRSRNISFVEEFEPFDNVHYSLDIAWPYEKIAIEVNGNQHYTHEGKLKPYYKKRHDFLVSNGWKIIELPYSYCYNLNNEKINELFEVPIDNEKYRDFITKKELKRKQKEDKLLEKIKNDEKNKTIIFNLINNSGIDFSKQGWSKKAQEYIKQYNRNWNNGVFRIIKRYYPDFLKQDDVWKRKGTIY